MDSSISTLYPRKKEVGDHLFVIQHTFLVKYKRHQEIYFVNISVQIVKHI